VTLSQGTKRPVRGANNLSQPRVLNLRCPICTLNAINTTIVSNAQEPITLPPLLAQISSSSSSSLQLHHNHHHTSMLVQPLNFIHEMINSILGRDSCYPDRVSFRGFPQSLQVIAEIMLRLGHFLQILSNLLFISQPTIRHKMGRDSDSAVK
jgi:hypothetical protein